MRLYRRAVFAATIAIGLVATATGTAAASDSHGRSNHSEHHESGHGHEHDANLERLAQQQTAMWGTFSEDPASKAAGFSPPTCGAAQPNRSVFMLPVNNGDAAANLATSCNVRSGLRILADLGGSVLTEDNSTTPFPVSFGELLFSRENLERICADAMDKGNGATPAVPTAVTLDGKPVAGITPIATDEFDFKVVPGTPLANDAKALGHPNTLAMSYCGYKVLLPPLSKGTHVLKATVLGKRNLTWNINVTR